MNPAQREAIRLIVRALNIILAAQGEGYRVKGEVTITRYQGYTIIAVPETTPDQAVDCNPPIVNI